MHTSCMNTIVDAGGAAIYAYQELLQLWRSHLLMYKAFLDCA